MTDLPGLERQGRHSAPQVTSPSPPVPGECLKVSEPSAESVPGFEFVERALHARPLASQQPKPMVNLNGSTHC